MDALAAVISFESGFDARAKNPWASASGLIQVLDSTAKSLGFASAAEVRELDEIEQLSRVVEPYFARAFAARAPTRGADYYAALLGQPPGRPDSFVLFSENDPKVFKDGTANAYDLNRGLDFDKDGQVTIGDLGAKVAAIQAAANGERLSAEPTGLPLVVIGATIFIGTILMFPEVVSGFLAKVRF